jgi:hypothetical protein
LGNGQHHHQIPDYQAAVPIADPTNQILLFQLDAEGAQAQSEDFGSYDAEGGPEMHESSYEWARLGSAQSDTDERSQEIQQLQIDKYMSDAHLPYLKIPAFNSSSLYLEGVQKTGAIRTPCTTVLIVFVRNHEIAYNET